MKPTFILFACILCLSFSSLLTALAPDSAVMEKRWEEEIRNGIIVEIRGATEFDPALQSLFNLSERFQGDFSRGISLVQFSASHTIEAERILQDSKLEHNILQASSEKIFMDRGHELFPQLERSRFMKKEPTKIVVENAPAPAQGPGFAAGLSVQENPRSACAYSCLSEGFEGNVWYENGGPWTHFQATPPSGHGHYYWTNSTCDAHGGSYCADAVRGGSSGSSLSCSDTYPAGMTCSSNGSWMEYAYAITCAAGASCADLQFYYKISTQNSADQFLVFFSIDNITFYGWVLSGNLSSQWYLSDSSLTTWPYLGDLTLYSGVVLAFQFCTDASNQSGFGARIDDVSLTYTSAIAPPPCALNPSPPDGGTGISTSPTLSWTASSGATGYDIYFGAGSPPGYAGTTSSTSWVVPTSPLGSGTKYFWQIVPKNSSGGASGCAVWSFTTAGGGAPACASSPSPPSGTTGVATTPTLSWPSVSGATSYDVYFGAGSSPSYVTNIAGTTYSPGSLSASTLYSWKIAPKNSNGSASGCPVWNFTTASGSACGGTPLFIAASAHAAGGGGSQWRTDVGLFNTSASTATVYLQYLPQGGDNSGAACLAAGSIAGSASMSLNDVVLSVAGVSNGAGGLAVYGTTTLVANSRTFNQGASGTFGQGIPGHPASQAMGAGAQKFLIQLHENSAYRTNVGFLNAGGASTTFTLTLYDEAGTNLGTLSYTLLPYEQKQVGQIFKQVTSNSITDGRITINVTGGALLAYASVVDNITGDPTYIEPQSP